MSNFDDGAEEARLEASKTFSQNRESRSNFFHALLQLIHPPQYHHLARLHRLLRASLFYSAPPDFVMLRVFCARFPPREASFFFLLFFLRASLLVQYSK